MTIRPLGPIAPTRSTTFEATPSSHEIAPRYIWTKGPLALALTLHARYEPYSERWALALIFRTRRPWGKKTFRPWRHRYVVWLLPLSDWTGRA